MSTEPMSTEPVQQHLVDAFTSVPFRGNPAAVVVLDAEPSVPWMQQLAAENNLSETAFVVPLGDVTAGAPTRWGLRWFTPAVEVALCGHATLATAHVLWERGLAVHDQIDFDTASGPLRATRDSSGGIELDFPADPPAPADPPPGLLDALGLMAVADVQKARFDHLIVVGSDEEVRACEPDHRALRQQPLRGVIVTALASADAPPGGGTEPVDVVSRFFAPGAGIDEDPVTGSAHCVLGPYWAERLGRRSLTAYQASSRGGIVHVEVRGDRVGLRGHAVTVARAVLDAVAVPPRTPRGSNPESLR